MKTIIGATLHEGQYRVLKLIRQTEAMYYTICTPRGWGKSFFAIQLMLNYALNNSNTQSMFVSLTYAQASKVFKELVKGLKGSDIIEKNNASENSIIFKNGSELYFKSIQQPDNLLGYHLDYLYLDEAARYKQEIFERVLRPFLNIKGKKCFLFSTPKGKNWFYNIFQKGKDRYEIRYESYTGSNTENPYANIEEINDARRTLPETIYEQEYEAKFIEDGGEVFTKIERASQMTKFHEPESDKIYYGGIDVGRAEDYTVLTIIDRDGYVHHIERVNQQDWSLIASKIANILNKFKPRYTLVETNGVGDVFYSNLKKLYSRIDGWTTTNQSKQDIIEELILAFQDEKIKIPNKTLFPQLTEEINDFSFEYSTKTRKIVYAARTGHDDCVMSLAMANHARVSGLTKGQYTII